jgi:hypothetical protein
MMRYLYSVVIMIAIICTFAASTDEFTKKLQAYFSDSDGSSFEIQGFKVDELEKAALEVANSGIPIFEKALNSDDEEKRYTAAYFLALIANEKAHDTLLSEYNRTGDMNIKSLLCFVMAATGTPKDVKFLMDSLEGEQIGNDWQSIESAALSLGVLKRKEAETALKNCAERGGHETIGGDAAECALKWMERQPTAPQETSAPEREQIILAMFRSGIPRTDWSNNFYERDKNLRWSFANGIWRYDPVVSNFATKSLPAINFDVYVTADDSDALVAVGMTFGPMNGKGYNYRLRKQNGSWKVIGIFSTWIS